MNTNGEMDTRQYLLSDYTHIYTKESFARLKKAIDEMAVGGRESIAVELEAVETYGNRDNIVTLSVFRRTKKGAPTVIVGVMADQTALHQQRRMAKDTMLRYQSIFSTSMVDMTYYNTEGLLTDINNKCCETFGCSREELLSENVPFNFAIEDADVTVDKFEGCYSTHLIKAVDKTKLADSVSIVKDVYYEQQLVPVYDSDNRFLGIFGSGRDVTEFVESCHQLKRSIKNTENVIVDVRKLSDEHIEKIGKLSHVYDVKYTSNRLTIKCSGGRHNISHVIDYFADNNLDYDRIYSELPTLNDVFLEITGKSLRDKEA
jgi:PAS domain S-box-containing protein